MDADSHPRDVDDGERSRLRRLVEGQPPGVGHGLAGALERVCCAAVEELWLTGATVTVLPSTGAHVVAAASSPAARRLEELQFDVGEGPTGEASRMSVPVLVPDLRRGGLSRWPGWVGPASAAGLRAVFALPLHVGATRFGALTLYRARPVSLSPSRMRAALILAEIAVEVLVDSSLPEQDGSAALAIDQALDGHALIYQAQGMVMVQLGVSLPVALARMRAHAYARGQDLVGLSSEIVEGSTILRREPK